VNKALIWIILVATVALSAAASRIWPLVPRTWSEADAAVLESLWIGNLPDLPPDPSNAVADDPRAASLGHELFFSKSLSPATVPNCVSLTGCGKVVV
jgi:cytochrome c peroxidase